jgi:hypothetical protein
MFDAPHERESKMRTTLTIDDDVLAAAKSLAVRQRKSVGDVISALARQALRPHGSRSRVRNGVPLLPAHAGAGKAVTPELVNRLRDEIL